MKQIRNNYFRLLDQVVAFTGHSKYDLHMFWKEHMIPFMLEDTDANFIKPSDELTTKNFTETGWNTFYNEFRHYCLDKFNIS